jgi:LAS superfamily LD-carboxypeptidase LdcB
MTSFFFCSLPPKAQRALQRMFTDAEKDGVSLYKISGFRSYETQDSTHIIT